MIPIGTYGQVKIAFIVIGVAVMTAIGGATFPHTHDMTVDASCGPSAVLWTVWTRGGQVQSTCPPLAHTRRPRAHILTASATTIHENGDGTGSDRFSDCFVIPGNPSTEQTGKFPWGFHETKRETTR